MNHVRTIIKFKLNVSNQTRRMLADVVYRCNLVRNFMVRYWVRWREDNPDYRGGNIVQTRRGKQRREANFASYDCQLGMREEARKKYPELAGIIVSSMLCQEVQDYLTGKTPYDHVGKARYRWQAIIGNEIQAPTHRKAHIPVHNQSSVLAWGAVDEDGNVRVDCSRPVSEKHIVRQLGKSQLVLWCPIWSKESGRGTSRAFVLEVGKQSEGRKHILRRIAMGIYKMSDSEIVEKDGEWYLHLCYQHPVNDNKLDADRTADLRLAKATDRNPFVIEAMDDGPRWLQDGKQYEHAIKHLRSRRAGIKYQSRTEQGGHKGHGRGRFYADVRPVSRASENIQRLFRARLVSAITQHCIKHACGKLVYHEPTAAEKSKSWFVEHGEWNRPLEFGWELFLSDLKHKCKLEGIEYASGEGDGEKPGAARGPQTGSPNGHASKPSGSGRGAGPKKANRSRGSVKGKPKSGDRMPSVARRS